MSNYDALIFLWEQGNIVKFFDELNFGVSDGTLSNEDISMLLEKLERDQPVPYELLCHKLRLDQNNLRHKIACHYLRYRYPDHPIFRDEEITINDLEQARGNPNLPSHLSGFVEREFKRKIKKWEQLDLGNMPNEVRRFLNG